MFAFDLITVNKIQPAKFSTLKAVKTGLYNGNCSHNAERKLLGTVSFQSTNIDA